MYFFRVSEKLAPDPAQLLDSAIGNSVYSAHWPNFPQRKLRAFTETGFEALIAKLLITTDYKLCAGAIFWLLSASLAADGFLKFGKCRGTTRLGFDGNAANLSLNLLAPTPNFLAWHASHFAFI